MATHDGGEIVVGEDHVGGLLGNLSPRNAHGNADVGQLERWRIVDAVARHGHHLPHLLQQPYYVLLVPRLRPAETPPALSLRHAYTFRVFKTSIRQKHLLICLKYPW